MALAFAAQAAEAPLRLIQTIPLPDGRGRIDHMDVDAAGQRLFVAELGNDTVAVIDLQAGKLMGRIKGVAEPQGVAFVPGPDRLFVTSGETGSVAIFDGATLAPVQEDALDSDADNIRYDPGEREIYVGFGNGGLGRLAALSGAHIDDIALQGHPQIVPARDRRQPDLRQRAGRGRHRGRRSRPARDGRELAALRRRGQFPDGAG